MMRRPISAITVGIRHRRDLGDVPGLAKSIEAIDLLHPIVITEDNVLVAGERRLAACRHLGWPDVPVTIVDLAEIARRTRTSGPRSRSGSGCATDRGVWRKHASPLPAL